MSKETREKMGEVVRTARALLDAIYNADINSRQVDEAVVPLGDALRNLDNYLFETVANVIKQDEAGALFPGGAAGISEPAPADLDDEILF